MVDRRRMARIARPPSTRTFGPWLKEHKLAREHLVAAFPEKSPQEIEAILAGVWDNLGRVAAEFAHLDRLHIVDPDRPGAERHHLQPAHLRSVSPVAARRQAGAVLRLASRQLGALRRCRAPPTSSTCTSLYRPPNIAAIAEAVAQSRAGIMGTLVPTGLDAPIRLARALERGGHVAMLVDQHYVARRRRHVLRPHLQGQPAAGAARPPCRLPDPRRAHRAAAGPQPVPRRAHRGDRAGARRRAARSTSPARCRSSPRWSKAGCASIRSSGCGCTAAGGDEHAACSDGCHISHGRASRSKAASPLRLCPGAASLQ